MKQVLIKKGQVIVEDIPMPIVNEGSVLVEVEYSLISAGTEIAGVAASGESPLRKVLKQPKKVKKALDLVKSQGFSSTIAKVKDKLESASPTGYSCSGTVLDVGSSIKDINIGDCVACAGAGYANHAEFVCVPRNLVVKIPDNLDLKEAASVTLGAIAIQGVRRASLTFGETVVVIGLGLVGQLTVQILVPAGNPQKLADAITVVLSDEDIAKRMGEAGYAIAKRLYDAEVNARQTFQLYEEILG